MRRFLLLTLLLLAAACERPTTIKLQGGNPPSFELSGSGRLEQVVIFGQKQRDVNSPLNNALWYVRPENPGSEGRFLSDIGVIRYGVVPEGYLQEYPENNALAPDLRTGVKYRYHFITSGAPHAAHYFEINNEGKPVELPEGQ